MILVSTDRESAPQSKIIFDDTHQVTEPAGALAGRSKNYIKREKCRGKNLVTIASGAGVNFDRLGYVTERT